MSCWSGLTLGVTGAGAFRLVCRPVLSAAPQGTQRRGRGARRPARQALGRSEPGPCSPPPASDSKWPPPSSSPLATTLSGCAQRCPSPPSAAPAPSRPPPARVTRHRLNFGGDYQANNALWRIALVVAHRLGPHVQRRTDQGLRGQTNRRGQVQARDHPLPESSYRPRDVQAADRPAGRTPWNRPARAAHPSPHHHRRRRRALGTWPIAISRLERDIAHDAELAA
jgi:hypothetical protein